MQLKIQYRKSSSEDFFTHYIPQQIGNIVYQRRADSHWSASWTAICGSWHSLLGIFTLEHWQVQGKALRPQLVVICKCHAFTPGKATVVPFLCKNPNGPSAQGLALCSCWQSMLGALASIIEVYFPFLSVKTFWGTKIKDILSFRCQVLLS